MTFLALSIAGSDSGGGAGIQADLKAFSALGVYGATAITAITAQNTRAVTKVDPVSPAMIRAQIAAVFDDLAIGAVKIGMLGDADAIAAVAAELDGRKVPVVVDPVMVAKSGDDLLPEAAIDALQRLILPHASLLTPNLPEAARLLGCAEASDAAEMRRQGRALIEMGARAVLMKDGHGTGAECRDLLVLPEGEEQFTAPRRDTQNTHGTGCTLSAAIAALLARGFDLSEAVRGAHQYLQGAIAAADELGIGRGYGPVHHFHAVWPDG
ncbi:bifunctional hydroxymethylpyrimidine kinase/phosphomethylpyrimidine kinase [Pontibaca salina]|uniref:hydroxymethylpyrimidine kinase n=1 Tax=Pontibaca salina TaxID=2795731 RepID=A0A934HK49_9RHOB|nr:bifunctional hydroxymethylpyrimidine kinase/phosphomethylpyrimidine kinase [Pontibaca salina]MBI6629598.1 bifunctional hydroxymethylpyrimidine kinase/phosphomethylpyrimidine kinase [Pontibaca salina]